MKKVYVFDLETVDIFTATFLDRDSDELYQFVISKNKDQRKELFEFLNTQVSGLIGYNSLKFDSQILEFMYRNPECTPQEIKDYAELIIFDENKRSDVPEWKLRIPQLDLFKALSLSVKAKRTSLKWCEYQMDLDNIEDMPDQKENNTWEEELLKYNLNDVIATKELYLRNLEEIELRKTLTQRENINLLNSTEPDLAKKLFCKYLAKNMNILESDLKTMRTERDIVDINEIILSYISFKTQELQQVQKEFQKLALSKTDKFEFIIPYKGINIIYGLGGLHASVEKKIIKSNDKYIIKSVDVRSFYPNLAIRNKLHPQHIPQEIFCNLYESLYNERISIPKKDPRNYILKIMLNATYGMSNDDYSFLKDRKFTLSICINGQLSLSMLFEELLLRIPEAKLLIINTDGFEILLPRESEHKYYEICDDWQQLTKLELEFNEYKQLIIKDVNNYIGEYLNSKTKCKGCFEFENIPLHKNKSHNIIPIAFYQYFINNKSIEETILNHKNIFDFCAGIRAKKSEKKGHSHFELHSIKDGVLFKQKLSKTVRYFISNRGAYLYKVYENRDITAVEAPKKSGSFIKDWKITYFNKAFYPKDFKDYNIDYSFYISKAREWITEIENKQQLNLF
jgi:hypothetical protein